MTFYNIFSKKKVKQEKLKIIVDHREKNSLVISELKALGFEIELKQLPVADYLVNNIAIERKTISDFKSSIINKRIRSQLIEIKQYPQYLLILEGINSEIYNGGIHENAFRGFLLSAVVENKIPLIYTLNAKDTACYLYILAKKQKKSHFSLRASKILLSDKERLQFILEGFPSIGPKTAKKILEHYKSINNFVNTKEEELKKLIGKKSEDVFKFINLKY